MPVPFGFSASDVFALTQLIFKVSKALSDSRGSQTEYNALLQMLLSLHRAINMTEEFALQTSLSSTARDDPLIFAPLNGIISHRNECHKLIENFMNKSEKYTASFVHGTGRAKALKKITWCLFHEKDVEKLERELRVHVEAIQLYNSHLGFQSLKTSLTENPAVLAQIDNRTSSLYDMVNHLSAMIPKALGYPWEGGLLPNEQPLRLLDALGRDLKIPTIFLSSPQIFHDMLEIIHRDLPGYDRIVAGEYNITDGDAEGQIVDAENECINVVSAGKTAALNIIIYTPLLDLICYSCPRCGSTIADPGLKGWRRRCQTCQLMFSVSDEGPVEGDAAPWGPQQLVEVKEKLIFQRIDYIQVNVLRAVERRLAFLGTPGFPATIIEEGLNF
ncbi:hypothetical protein FQN54_006645 [Arachnomyces sp. PD_36]|nr:hypothetical protein FQN54_006645 [Arachnomyces sp. PD_36]